MFEDLQEQARKLKDHCDDVIAELHALERRMPKDEFAYVLLSEYIELLYGARQSLIDIITAKDLYTLIGGLQKLISVFGALNEVGRIAISISHILAKIHAWREFPSAGIGTVFHGIERILKYAMRYGLLLDYKWWS